MCQVIFIKLAFQEVISYDIEQFRGLKLDDVEIVSQIRYLIEG